jgi:hypothetical protein
MNVKSFSGPLLDEIVELDRFCPGFVGSYFRSSDEKRQVIAANLLVDPPARTPAQMGARAEFLQGSRHKTILQATFRRVPTGFRGALGRAGPVPHGKRFYTALHTTLQHPPHSKCAKTISRLPTLDLLRIQLVRLLPALLCAPGFVQALRSMRHAHDVLRVIDLLTRHGVDQTSVIAAARQISSVSQQNSFWQRWALKATFPPHPVPASAAYRPIRDGRMLQSMAHRFSNCSMRYLIPCLDGRDAFAEFSHGVSGAVVHLRRREATWHVEGVFARNNVRPDRGLCTALLAYTAKFGIAERELRQEPRGDWDVLRRLSMPHSFEIDFPVLDEDDHARLHV